MSLKLPPLNALKAFESAARTGSYVSAAEELHVSPAAVSQQVRKLEEYFSKQLFTRYNNRILLTDAGVTIYTDIAPSLQEISQKTRQMLKGSARAHIVVSVLPSLAQSWFIPRLVKFSQHNPNVSIQTRIEDDPVDFARHDIDLRICYGTQLYTDFKMTKLFHDSVQPMCSLEFFRQHRLNKSALHELADDCFLHTVWGSSFASQPGWSEWFANCGVNRKPAIKRGHQIAMPGIALECARLGMGVLLGQRQLAASDLDEKRLISLSDQSIALGYPYYAVYPHAKAKYNSLQSLLECLL